MAQRLIHIPDLFEVFCNRKEYRSALAVFNILKENGWKAYFVGGCVRDAYHTRINPELVLGRIDFDVATNASEDEVNALFPHTLEVGKRFGITVVVENGVPIEVAQFRSEGDYLDGRHPETVAPGTVQEDSNRRDFTVNALFYDPSKGDLLDFHNGIQDLQRRKLRFIGSAERRVQEDYLRILRGVRFSGSLGFELSPESLEAISKNAELITQVSIERVTAELKKMLESPRRAQCIDLMSTSGLMQYIIPEIEAMRGVRQPPKFHPEGDVYIHTILVLKYLPQNADFSLALAGLLHDVGKPETFTESDKIRFYGHDQLGASMARDICKRLKVPTKTIQKVMWLIANHMRYSSIKNMRKGRALHFLTQDWGWDSLELYRADVLASFKKLESYEYCLSMLLEMKERPEAFIKGSDIIAYGVIPGPVIGKIKEYFFTNQLEGKYESREDALSKLPEVIKEFTE